MAELQCTFASLPKTTRGQALVLGGDPRPKDAKNQDAGETFLYCNGKNVYIRNINDASKCDVYYDHAADTTVAKYSPTGFYIASGDASGKIRIWDTVNREHILKYEYQPLGGALKDIAWDGESKRIAVGGVGRGSYARVFLWDSGSTVGDINGHTKDVNSVSIKQNRPYRLVTASEDQTAMFFEGPPFKNTKTLREHTNFVNCVRYSPKGDFYVTGGADGRAFVYEGKTGEVEGQLVDPNVKEEKAHSGGIYALDFSPDGSEVLTVSGDKHAKIWNLASKQPVVTFKMGNDIKDMQLGCLWQKDNILTVSLSGYINYLDRNNPSSPSRILKGHNKPITSMAATADKGTVYTGDSEGQIYYWDVNTGICEVISGKGHTNKVSDMTVAGDALVSVSMDDTVRYTSITSNQYGSNSCKLPSQPTRVAALDSGISVITCLEHIVVVDQGNEMFQQAVTFGPSCVDIHPGRQRVAIGACNSKDVHIFSLDGPTLTGVRKIDIGDDVTGVKYSPDGAYLAVITGSKRFTSIFRVDGDEYTEVYTKATKQNAKLFCVDWSPDSQHISTGSLDGSIVVWCLEEKYDKRVTHYIREAHRKGQVEKVAWLSDNIILSCSNDSCIKKWCVKF